MTSDELATLARGITRATDRGALATADRDRAGHPFASFVAVATAPDGAPLLLVSALSEHTKNLAADARASLLLVAGSTGEDPLAGPRVTLVGRLVLSDAPGDRDRYLRRHPAASLYAGFTDFSVQRLEVERVHLVAGFGTAKWLPAARVRTEPLFDDMADERAWIGRLHDAERGVLDRIASTALGAPAGTAIATGIDREGFDLRAGARTGRASFAEPLAGALALGPALEALARA